MVYRAQHAREAYLQAVRFGEGIYMYMYAYTGRRSHEGKLAMNYAGAEDAEAYFL